VTTCSGPTVWITTRGWGIPAEVSFAYDPEIIGLVRSVPRAHFDRDRKVWLVPDDAAGSAVLEPMSAGPGA
jgi:hypothetical protein